MILGAMATDRQSPERRHLNEKRAVSIIYSLVYGQSQRANWFQVTLQGFGITSRGMEMLRKMGFRTLPRTVNNANEGFTMNYSETVRDVFKNAAEKVHMDVIL